MTRWDDASCLEYDPELWFPTPGDRTTTLYAKAICKGCPILADCRAEAIPDPSLAGVWGGLTEKERQRLRRGRSVPRPRHYVADRRRGA